MRISEDNYLKELKSQNDKALMYIIDKYSSLVNVVVRGVLNPLKDNGLVEECVSDVFISVWNNIDKFKGDNSNFKNWIGGISKYKAIDYYRKYKSSIINVEIVENEIVSSSNIELEAIEKVETSEIIKLVNKLSEPDKSIFIMKFIYGYSSKKISQSLGLTVSNVDTRVCRGKTKLKSKYMLEVAYE